MAYKRSRATYETDLQAQQSPYVFYGTALPPIDPDVRDDGSYVPIWKQEVTDERGRKRLHGAFTGGFSAGYFNTVGSKEGWTPSTFVSSRSGRAQDEAKTRPQRAEDFMDEEDLADAAEAQRLQTSGSFSGLGWTEEEARHKGSLMDILKPVGETMGVKLLRRMGWKDGQGIGAKVRRKARLDDHEDEDGDSKGDDGESHLFAPRNTQLIGFVKKNDQKGLGYEGEARAGTGGGKLRSQREDGSSEEEDGTTAVGIISKPVKHGGRNGAVRGGLGVGILNDTGSDDEDPFELGPRVSYSKVLGGASKKKKKQQSKATAVAVVEKGRTRLGGASNPLLGSKPVFISKRASASSTTTTTTTTTTPTTNAGFRKCHDGRLPLDGFVLASDADTLSFFVDSAKKYPPPLIPKDWKSSKQPSPTRNESSYQSTADVAKASSLDPKSRASLLGEAQLPGKSVFDFLSSAARDRIASASGKSDLPAGLGESAPKGFETSEDEKARQRQNLIPNLDKDVAMKALGRGVGGWMPYAEDEAKRGRYRSFLEMRAGLRSDLPERSPAVSTEDWVKELQEFAHAAQIFRPMTGMMASRFTSSYASSSTAANHSQARPATDETTASSNPSTEEMLRKPAEKPKDPAEAAAAVGMFGPMTRSTQMFYPTRLLCKRFNVRPPVHVQPDAESNTGHGDNATTVTGSGGRSGAGAAGAGAGTKSTALPTKSLELVSKAVVSDMLRESKTITRVSLPEQGQQTTKTKDKKNNEEEGEEIDGDGGTVGVDVNRNLALEGDRPGEAVFKAIFGSDDDDDDDDEG